MNANKMFPFFIGLMFSNISYSQTLKDLCFPILETAKINTGYNKEQFKEMNDYLSKREDIDLDLDIKPQNKSTYKIKIEEVKEGKESIAKKLDLNCDVVSVWSVNALPKFSLKKSNAIKDLRDPELAGSTISMIRNGLKLTRFFHDSKEFFSISLLWNSFLEKSQSEFQLPSFIDDHNSTRRDLTPSVSKYPVKGLRFSTTGKFGNIWYLVTPKAIEAIGDGEFLSPLASHETLDDSLLDVTSRSATVDFLEYYDSLNRQSYFCSDILAKSKEDNCYHFNYLINPDLWDRMEKRETVWIQMIVELSEGYLIQTYSLGGDETSDLKLLSQQYESDLSKFNIPTDLVK